MNKAISTHVGGARQYEMPRELQGMFKKAKLMEWITVGYLVSVVIVMYLAMGSSAAMKAAWVEDVVSMFPALAFLVASHFYDKKSSPDYPYGHHKAFTVAFIAGSVALFVLGLYILIDSALGLWRQEHPTIGTFNLWGREIWMGWLMVLALLYSFIPAVILGRKKKPIAKNLHEKVLFVDSEAQKADWMTAGAGIAGIIGIGFGLWWLDSAAAIFISLSIVRDGYSRSMDSVKDLMEALPKTYDSKEVHPLVKDVVEFCLKQDWIKDVRVRMREHGMVFFGDVLVIPAYDDNLVEKVQQLGKQIEHLDWKIQDVVVSPVRQFRPQDYQNSSK